MDIEIVEDLVGDLVAKVETFLDPLAVAWSGKAALCPSSVMVQGAASEHFEILGVVPAWRIRIVEGMSEAHAVHGRLRDAADGPGGFDTQRIEDGGDHVDRMGILGTNTAPGCARRGWGQAGEDSPMVLPITPGKGVPAWYSLTAMGLLLADNG
jgi:hypothetical protein